MQKTFIIEKNLNSTMAQWKMRLYINSDDNCQSMIDNNDLQKNKWEFFVISEIRSKWILLVSSFFLRKMLGLLELQVSFSYHWLRVTTCYFITIMNYDLTTSHSFLSDTLSRSKIHLMISERTHWNCSVSIPLFCLIMPIITINNRFLYDLSIFHQENRT